MVRDEVWKQSGFPKQGKRKADGTREFIDLHIHCLENLIGRKLEKVDFTDVPLNYITGRL